MEKKYSVIIIGAGLSGLRTAQMLEKGGRSDVLILEARDRVGGRTTGTEWNNYQWDLGGQWLGPTQDRMYQLVKDVGLSTFPQVISGKKGFMKKGGQVKHYSGLIPPVNPLGLIDMQLALWKFDAFIRSFPLDRDLDLWEIPQLQKYDKMSVASWADANMWTEAGKELLRQAVRAVLTVESSEVSFLFWLHYIRGAGKTGDRGSWKRLFEVSEGAQQDRILGGSYSVSQRLSKSLQAEILLSHPVRRVTQLDDRLEVETEDGSVFQAEYAVLSLPPALQNFIEFHPPLPTSRDDLGQRFPMGKVIKCLAFYETNFWRDGNFSGEIISQDDIITMGFEGSLPDGSRPSLVSFICGQSARVWSEATPEARRQAVLESLAKFVGPKALEPIHYLEKDWSSDPWSRGGYTGVTPPGVLTSVGNTLRAPVGRLHFGGTETAREWPGYMEGALESGERVANELLLRLAGKSLPKKSQLPPETSSFSRGRFLLMSSLIVGVVAFLLVKVNGQNGFGVFK